MPAAPVCGLAARGRGGGILTAETGEEGGMKLTLLGDSTVARATPPAGETFVTILGDTRIDLTRAPLPPTLHLRAVSLVGDLTLRVPPGTVVEVAGVSLIGDRTVPPHRDGDTAADAGQRPTVRVTAYTLVGDVRVVEADR